MSEYSKKQHKKRFFIMGSVLFTSLPAFILAEVFFAVLYALVMQSIAFVYSFLSSFGSTAQIEANMQIFSPLNILIFFIGLGLISLIMCLEIMTIIAITMYDYYRNDHIPLRTLIHFSYTRLRSLIRFRHAPLFLFIFLFPKFQIGPSGILALDIPPFIIDEIIKFPTYTIFIVIFAIFLAYIIYRSIFVLHYLLFERSTIIRAIKSSFALTKSIGYKKMLLIILQNFSITLLFILPIIAIGVALARYILHIEKYLGNVAVLLADLLSYIMEFLTLGLTGALMLAGITIAYIRHSGFGELHFKKRFYFLGQRPPFTPRWHNVRMTFQKKYPLIFIGILIALSPIFLFVIARGESYNLSNQPNVISHRGSLYSQDRESVFIENTIPAILEAKYQGANKVEIDVYENKSGTLILSHDGNLRRVAKDSRKIADLTDEDLENIRLINGEKIPTLAEVLSVANLHNIELIIEPKLHGSEKHIYKELIRLLTVHNMLDRTEIHSLNLQSLEEIKKINPHIPVGYIVFGGIGNLSPVGVDFISLQETLVTRKNIRNIQKSDKKVYVWTINSKQNIEKYMRLGVDAIITDHVPLIHDEIQKLLEHNSQTSHTLFRIWGIEFSIGK